MMKGLTGCFVLNQKRKDLRIDRMLYLEPGKKG